MWILLVLLALGFIIGSALILLRTEKTLPQKQQPLQLEHDDE